MSTWQEFYNEIRDPGWPDCPNETQFSNLPLNIQQECIDVFGYQPGAFNKTSKLKNLFNEICSFKYIYYEFLRKSKYQTQL